MSLLCFLFSNCQLEIELLRPSIHNCQSANSQFYPCFCLCFGFSQMIYTRRPRLMTLHFSHLTFTDARTFMTPSLSPFRIANYGFNYPSLSVRNRQSEIRNRIYLYLYVIRPRVGS